MPLSIQGDNSLGFCIPTFTSLYWPNCTGHRSIGISSHLQKQPKMIEACVQPDSPPVVEQRSFVSSAEAPSVRWHYPVANTVSQVTSTVHYTGLDGLRRRSCFRSSKPKYYGVSTSFLPFCLLFCAKTYQHWHFKISLITSAKIPGHETKLKPSRLPVSKAP